MVGSETPPMPRRPGSGGRIEDASTHTHVKHPSPVTSPKQQPSSPAACTSSTTLSNNNSTTSPSASSKLGASSKTSPKRHQHLDVSLSTNTSRTSTTPTHAMSAMLKEGTTPTQRISRAKKGKRVHACNHSGCEKVFTRAEHLRRHQLNHSTEVYYKCDMCERTFVRQDLLTRHTERHATQARKAVQTLALAQRHRQFSSHFGINGIAVLAAPPPPPTSDYGGNAHVFDTSSHPNPRIHSQDASVPQIINVLSPHQSSPTASTVTLHSSSAAYTPNYPAPIPIPIPISQPGESTPDFTPADSSTSPSVGGLQRPHLPFHLQHNEPQRQEQYMIPVTSHSEIMRPSLTITDHHHHQQQQQQQQQQQMYATRSWDNYGWLFDDSFPDQLVMELNQNQVTYLHPLEAQHYGNAGEASSNKGSSGALVPAFHPMDDTMRSQVLLLVGDAPNLHSGNVGMAAMQRYLRLYWTEFHPMFPLLHRPTFVPSIQMVMLVAIVLAIGASFADADANNFAMVVYDKVKGWILNSEEFSSHSPNVITQQLILLTDVFGKMRSTRSQLEGTQLDFILLNNLRRGQVVSSDPLQNIRRCHRQGLEFDYQSEWQTWIDLESKKRVALLFFYWDTQQATLFGREMCQTVFDVRLQLPCEEFLWNASTPGEWFGKLDGVQEGLGLLEALKIFLDCRREPPALSPLSLVLVLHGLIAVGLDLQRRSPSIGHTSDDPATKQSRISRAFETWRGQLESLVPQVLLQSWYQKVLLMYHMAHIALHTNRQNLLVGAGDRRFCRRNSNDFYRAKQELQQWASIPSAQLAAWHAVQILLRCLGNSQMYHQDLYVSWSTYVATLICYTYGNMSTSSSEVVEQEDAVVWDLEQDMRAYLQMMNTDTWESLSHVRRHQRKRTDGLLAVVRNTMKLARWGLVQEGLEVLKRLGGATIKSV